MLHSNDLLTIETMPSWSDISLALYKEFSEQYLIQCCRKKNAGKLYSRMKEKFTCSLMRGKRE